MDDELRALRRGPPVVPPKEIAAVVKTIYPRFDRFLLSKCEHGDEYGIRLRDDALDALRAKFAPAPVATAQESSITPKASKHTSGGHRLKCRISCRLEDDVHADLIACIKADGYETVQDWLTEQVCRYLLEWRRDREH